MMLIARLRALLVLIAAGITLGSAAAQAEVDPLPQRDAVDLAARYLGYDGAPLLPEIPPRFTLGEQLTFNVPQSAHETPTPITATLVAFSRYVYLWVDDAIELEPNPVIVQSYANALSSAFQSLRLYDNFHRPLRIGSASAIPNPIDVVPVPDVDLDPRVFIVYTRDLSEAWEAVHNPLDSLLPELSPGGFSNARETIYVNTTLLEGVPLEDTLFYNAILRAWYSRIMAHISPTVTPWLVDALQVAQNRRLNRTALAPEDVQAFLQEPETGLLRQAAFTDRAAVTGGQQLFLSYLSQRYGASVILSLFTMPGEGIAPINAALAFVNATDAATLAPVTGRDLFADFVIANAVNALFGDGRHAHTSAQLTTGQLAAVTSITNLRDAALQDETVGQFGARYYEVTAGASGRRVSVAFSGAEHSPRFSMPLSHDPEDVFFWSGAAPDRNTHLTRSLDLTGVENAALTFDAWYDLADSYSYGYVSVSTDGGSTWTPLPATTTSTRNRHGAAYGVGFTGISNPNPPRPFPIMGVLIAADGITVSDVTPGGAAATGGVLRNDRIIGYEGTPWQTTPDVIAMLSNYAPGDTLTLLIERGDQTLDLPIVLGAHPTRIVLPEPRWEAQTVDLTPYAGQEILLRFEYISLPGHADGGFAVDNITIEAIGYQDDASDPDGWTLIGWQQVDNRVPQQWLVQALTTGTQNTPPRVRPLIGVGDEMREGSWTFTLGPNEALLIAVSALNDDTGQPARYDITFGTP